MACREKRSLPISGNVVKNLDHIKAPCGHALPGQIRFCPINGRSDGPSKHSFELILNALPDDTKEVEQ